MARRASAEFAGTALLVTAVVGSGIAASRLSPDDVGLQLLENSTATGLALWVLILIFGPVSGAHFNPIVTLIDWWHHRHTTTLRDAGAYIFGQILGAVAGCVLANVMFGLSAISISRHERTGGPVWLGEVVATGGLVLLIFGLARGNRGSVTPAAVGGYIAAAYWFTSSTSFANPAVTIGHMFTDTFAGIAPISTPGFIAAQLVGAAVGTAAFTFWYPTPALEGAPR